MIRFSRIGFGDSAPATNLIQAAGRAEAGKDDQALFIGSSGESYRTGRGGRQRASRCHDLHGERGECGALVAAASEDGPSNGSEIVLFDLNWNAKVGQLLRTASDTALTRLLPAPPRLFRTTIMGNANPDSSEEVERVTEAGTVTEQSRALGLSYPPGVYSLSHVALPFPISDSLYGMQPDPAENFGVNLGAVAPRGERGTLIISLDALLRMSSNPFFPYMIARIEEGIPATPIKAATPPP